MARPQVGGSATVPIFWQSGPLGSHVEHQTESETPGQGRWTGDSIGCGHAPAHVATDEFIVVAVRAVIDYLIRPAARRSVSRASHKLACHFSTMARSGERSS